MKKKETIIFELCSSITSNYEDASGYRRSTARSYSLPATATILFTDEDEDTYIKSIRYVKSHKSIYIDDQEEEHHCPNQGRQGPEDGDDENSKRVKKTAESSNAHDP